MAISFKPKNTVKRVYKRVVLGGVGSSGKSTAMGTIAKKPLVIDLDDRWPNDLVDKSDFIKFDENFMGVKRILNDILNEPKIENDWIVLDTATKLMALVEEHVIALDCKGDRDKYNNYGHGLKFVPQYVREILGLIDEIQEKHKVNFCFICHTRVKQFSNPLLAEGYQKNCLDLPDIVSGMLMQWADYVGYAWFSTEVVGKRAVGDFERFVSFTPGATYEAKNSSPFILPEKIVFDKEGKWANIVFGDTQELLKELTELVARYPEDRRKDIQDNIDRLHVKSFGQAELRSFIDAGKSKLGNK